MRPGLLAKTLLLILLILAGAAVAVHHLYVPSIIDRARSRMREVADECLSQSRRLMEERAFHLAERNRRRLLDLPFELTAGDPERTREMVGEYAQDFGRTFTRNVDLLTSEFRRRMGVRTRLRAEELGEELRGHAVAGLMILLAALLLLNGAALVRNVLVPLSRILLATERVAKGDLTIRVDLRRSDEVGRLGQAFDRMTGALEDSREEIEELNSGLSEKVREKTRELGASNLELREANEQLVATIAELKTTRDALVHSETMASIGTLAGGVAHEFNNLLGGILGCAEDARTEEDPELVRAALDMILRTGRRACNITENLLRFSRPPERIARPTEINRLVSEALELVGPEARRQGVELHAELATLGPVTVDPGQIHQVVLNLLTNALHSMESGGRLEATVRREGEIAVIEVRDTGRGISEKNLPRIFDPFFTTRDRAEDGPGTGLGLSVSYSIVKEHGGTIEVESRIGKGSVFTVRLPAEEGGS